jgi:pilus assembly protein CpaE
METQDTIRVSPNASLPASEPLSMASIRLDSEAAADLRQFIASTPLLQVHSEVKTYPKDDDPLFVSTAENGPDICLIDLDPDRSKAIQTAEKIHEKLPGTAVFAISSDSRSDYILQAMRCGCVEYLVKPVNLDHLLDAVARVGGKKTEKRPQLSGELLTLIGAKGGAGVTTLATHLGALLAKSCSRKTLLVDFHKSLGDAALYLGITRQDYDFCELAANVDRLDSALLQSFVLHHSSGLDVLPAPSLKDSELHLPTESLGQTFDFLRSRYEFVLVDCAPGLSEHNVELLRRSNQIYVIAVPEVSALRNVVHYLDFFARQEFPADRVHVVLNRHQKRNGISDQEVEKAIHHRIYWKVPNQYSHVVRTITAGDPSSALDNSEVARSLMAWAGALGSRPQQNNGQKKPSRGLLGFLGG